MLNIDNDEVILNAHFDALKREIGTVHAPVNVDAVLSSAFEKQFPRRAWYRRWGNFSWLFPGSAFAGVLAAIIIFNQPEMLARLGLSVEPKEMMAANVDPYEDIPFVAINSGEVILRQENIRIVQAKIPNTLLQSMGVVFSPQSVGDSSRAEMLVGANDEYLAVRFLPN